MQGLYTGFRHSRTPRWNLFLVIVLAGPMATGGLRGHGNVKDMGGAGGQFGRPGTLLKHPYTHGGFDRDHLDERILHDTLSLQQGTNAEPKTELSVVLDHCSRDVAAGKIMGLPEAARRVAWIAGAWEHGLREIAKTRRERKEFEEIMECDTVIKEGLRRWDIAMETAAESGLDVVFKASKQADIIADEELANSDEERVNEYEGDEKQQTRAKLPQLKNQPEPQQDEEEKNLNAGPNFVRYCEGLYWNVSSASWYDTRPPRRVGKPRHPSPEPHQVFGDT